MVKIKCFDEIFECSKVVKGPDYIYLYDNNSEYPTVTFGGINDFSTYELLEGEWTYPEPTNEDVLQGKVDYLAMMVGIELEE